MRPKFSMWSDYGAPAQKHWMPPKRGTGSSIGPKILLAAAVVVAGVIGTSGIFPQVIDAGWVQDSPTHLPKMSSSDPTIKRSGIVAAIPLPPRRAVTTGEATLSSPPAPERGDCDAAGLRRESRRAGQGRCAAAGACTNRCGQAGRKVEGRCGGEEGRGGAEEGRAGQAPPTQLPRGLRPVWRVGLAGWRLDRLLAIWKFPPVLSTLDPRFPRSAVDTAALISSVSFPSMAWDAAVPQSPPIREFDPQRFQSPHHCIDGVEATCEGYPGPCHGALTVPVDELDAGGFEGAAKRERPNYLFFSVASAVLGRSAFAALREATLRPGPRQRRGRVRACARASSADDRGRDRRPAWCRA